MNDANPLDASSVFADSLPVPPSELYAQLDAEGVSYRLFEHVPLRTVEDSKQVEHLFGPRRPGHIHIKNLYLRDRKKRNYLVVLEQDYDLDLKGLGDRIGAGRLSFGSAERLFEYLGVRPGAVTPLAMITGVKTGVTLWMDPALKNSETVYPHPLVNDRTLAMTGVDLRRFLESLGVEINWL
ncbi:MAG: prolyl-tRNA synthetase associated domain-containing protein [Pseudomonadota bacterium]